MKLSRELHAIVFAGVMSETLRLETYRAIVECSIDRVLAAETAIAELVQWRAERWHPRPSLSYERRTMRRRSLERVRRVALIRTERVWAASMMLEEACDALEESGKRLAREYAAAREVIEELAAWRIARGSQPHM